MDDLVVIMARGPRRLVGLIGRRGLAEGVALEIPRCRSVHTFGMRFALDLVWLDADRRVVRVDRAVPPWRVRSCRQGRSVLELDTRFSNPWLASLDRPRRTGRLARRL